MVTFHSYITLPESHVAIDISFKSQILKTETNHHMSMIAVHSQWFTVVYIQHACKLMGTSSIPAFGWRGCEYRWSLRMFFPLKMAMLQTQNT